MYVVGLEPELGVVNMKADVEVMAAKLCPSARPLAMKPARAALAPSVGTAAVAVSPSAIKLSMYTISVTVKVCVRVMMLLTRCRLFRIDQPSFSVSGMSATYTGLLVRMMLVGAGGQENVAKRGEGPRSMLLRGNRCWWR